MPISRTNAKKKEDASQKIQEIKQRQQNWLRQREQSKTNNELRPAVASAPTSKPNDGARLTLTKKATIVQEHNKPHIQTKFKNWVSARAENDTGFDDTLSIHSDVESELARLVTPEVHHNKPVAEEEFGDLAEKIAHNVRSDLGLIHSLAATARTDSTEISEIESDHLTWQTEKCKTFTKDATNSFGSSGLTSHNCPICKKVMMSSRNVPMMVIPCGHTLCKACSEGRQNCPACDCSIVSLTVNIMLQQIIHEFHTQPQSAKFSNDSKIHQLLSGTFADQETQPKYIEENRRNRMASYTSQLVNLETRHGILLAEQGSLLEQQKHVTSQLRQSQHQMKSVAKQEQEVQKAILDLHERLSALQNHKQEYESQTLELTEEKSKVDGKVTMISSTIASLDREIEKVTLLAENEN